MFFDCFPYEWRSGTSDGLFLLIYFFRSMRVVFGFWWLVDFCNKYVSSLWLMLSPWIIHTLTLPPLLASVVPRNFRRYLKPTIYLPQNSHHTYLLWNFHSHFRDILPCNFPPFRLLWHASSLSYCFAWSCSWHRICGKATVHNSSIHVTLDSLHIPVHRRRNSYRVIFCSKYRVVVLEL